MALRSTGSSRFMRLPRTTLRQSRGRAQDGRNRPLVRGPSRVLTHPEPEPMLQIDVRKRLGSFTLEAALEVPSAGVIVVVGESGSGKTTLLRLIAGLVRPDQGRVALGGRTLDDVAAGLHVPARERPVGYVPQDYALFPHLSVRENVGFGLRASGTRGAALHERVERALERLGVQSLAARRPHQL